MASLRSHLRRAPGSRSAKLCLGLAALAALAGFDASPAATEVPPGTPIVAIRVVRHDIFDLDEPETSRAAYRWVNKLHVLTHEGFVRSILLFEIGDALDPLLLAESELLLRGTGFLNPVTVVALPVAGGAEVVVETRDQWSIGIDASYDVSGSSTESGFGIEDDNFLGTGKGIELEYESDAERTSTMVGYKDRSFRGGRWQIDLKNTSSSDGYARYLHVRRPFYSVTTPRAGGFEWWQASSIEHLWSNTEKSVAGKEERRDIEAWYGMRLPGSGIRTDRLLLGAFGELARFGAWTRSDGSPYPQPDDRDLIGPEIGWEHKTFRWQLVQGFRSWQRQEDLPLGPNWRVTTGLSLPALGGDRTRVRFGAAFDVARWREQTYLWTLADVTGRFESGDFANTLAHLELGGAVLGKAGLRLRAAADLGHDLDGERQLTLGADTGLRGYDPNSFDGTSRVVVNAEWRRRLTGEFLHVAVLGLTAFADGGKTWGARVGPSTEGWRGDVGVGLLLEITRASSVRIVRFEIAYPDRGSEPVFQITTQSLF
jgi:hypothetical protein